MDFLQRRDDQQLQIELLEQLQAVLGRLVGTAAKGFVYHHKPEAARAGFSCFIECIQTKLVSQAGGQNGVGELFFLPA